MRSPERCRLTAAALFFGCAVLALGCEQLAQLGTGGNGVPEAGAPSPEAGTIEAGVAGGGCGTEPRSGATLCIATSKCPNVVVDTQAMPSCGFRIQGGVVDLVCGCGTALCPMGAFTTCAEAKTLLSEQTESGVCVQLAEGRCTEGVRATSTSTSSTSSGGANPACDQQCVKACGGGAACASVCNCV
jgi:hypothetical protein